MRTARRRLGRPARRRTRPRCTSPHINPSGSGLQDHPAALWCVSRSHPYRAKPGSAWAELPRPRNAGAGPVGHARLGYARASTARQSLDSLAEAGVTRIFSEKISTRATQRPELDKAVALAGELRASGGRVTLVVHEHKRLGRGIELATLAEELKASDVGLEFLTGELQGSHDPSAVVFTVLAALSGMEREYIRDRTLEGHESAASAARPSAEQASPTTTCSRWPSIFGSRR
ncbi:recombinase family protein [Streptomyces sp. NPDC048411]|uniref:recombinase family protein n=1 Tax=Streptomyces sp. NPDC048411 TaxID=3157206 RepID=UPI0034518B4B